MNAVELTNDTGKTLDGGPVTVYEASAYAGEALMETLKASDKRLISYAIDLGTRVTTQFESTSNIVREIHFRRGILTARQAAQETRTYTIRNVDQKPKTLILEHPARPSLPVGQPEAGRDHGQRLPFRDQAGRRAPSRSSRSPRSGLRQHLRYRQPDAGCARQLCAEQGAERGRPRAARRIAQQKRLIAEADGDRHARRRGRSAIWRATRAGCARTSTASTASPGSRSRCSSTRGNWPPRRLSSPPRATGWPGCGRSGLR